MSRQIQYFIAAIIFVLIGWYANVAWNLPGQTNKPSVIKAIKPKPLEKYEIANLKAKYTQISASTINLGDTLKEDNDFTSRLFSYEFDPSWNSGDNKRVTGLVNIPNGDGPFPVIILLRGYVDQEIYETGIGTARVGEFFAKNGFITLSPDFLGYAGSSSEAPNIFESRFQTYTTASTLIKAVSYDNSLKIDPNKVFIWAHSNGGQIALTSLEVTGVNYPTALWAPNSAKFPYSILYYLDEAPDSGKLIIVELSKLMSDYDTDNFAFKNYLNFINSPIQIQQGTADEAVPRNWSKNLTNNLEDASVSATLVEYPGADHNLNPLWQNAINDSLTFFKSFFEVK